MTTTDTATQPKTFDLEGTTEWSKDLLIAMLTVALKDREDKVTVDICALFDEGAEHSAKFFVFEIDDKDKAKEANWQRFKSLCTAQTIQEMNESDLVFVYKQVKEARKGEDADNGIRELSEYVGDPEESYTDEDVFCLAGTLYCSDEVATALCTKEINEILWAFKAEFIAEHINDGLSLTAREAIAKGIRALQEDKCESCNDDIESMISDMDYFVEEAISADGRGHFLARYDGEENEVSIWLKTRRGEIREFGYYYRRD